jgi:hypothetical protein
MRMGNIFLTLCHVGFNGYFLVHEGHRHTRAFVNNEGSCGKESSSSNSAQAEQTGVGLNKLSPAEVNGIGLELVNINYGIKKKAHHCTVGLIQQGIPWP